MAIVPFLKAGDKLSVDAWNSLFEAANAKLVAAYGGQALAFWGQMYFRRFFFDSVVFSIWNPTGDKGFWRAYDHQPFTDMVNSLELSNEQDTPYGDQVIRPVRDEASRTVRLVTPDDATWAPRIWPGMTNPPFVSLQYSLEVHTRILDGKAYSVYLNEDTGFEVGPEYIHTRDPIEVVVKDYTRLYWPDNWNKYNIFRFNNVGNAALTVDFGGHFSVTIPAGRSQCVRRAAVNGPYTLGWDYLHRMLPGDPWFSDRPDDLSNLNCPAIVSSLLMGIHSGWAEFGQDGPYAVGRARLERMDGSAFEDVADTYNNSDYQGGSHAEMPMPAGGFFGPVADSTPIGDLLCHKGELAIVEQNGARHSITFDGMASLAGKLAQHGITLQAPADPTDAQLQLTCSQNKTLLGISTNLIQLAFGSPSVTVGPWITQLPCLRLHVLLRLDTQNQSNAPIDWWNPYSYYTFQINPAASGVPWEATYSNYQTVNPAWENHSLSCTGVGDKLFSFSATAGELLAYLRLSQGEALGKGSLRMTVMGPQFCWRQSRKADLPGGLGGVFSLQKSGDTWLYTRGEDYCLGDPNACGAYLFSDPWLSSGVGAGWPFYGATPATLAIHYPRLERRWAEQRHFNRTMKPFTGELAVFYPAEFYPDYAELGMVPVPLLEKKFFETEPIVKDGQIRPVASALQHRDKGVAYLGPHEASPNSALSSAPSGSVSLLPMQREHFNVLASTVNATIGTARGNAAQVANNRLTYLNAELAGNWDICRFPITGRGLGPWHLRPRTQWVGWDQRSFPEFVGFFEHFGVPVRTKSDFPASLQDYLNAKQLWYNGQATTEQRYDPKPATTYPNDPRPLSELWDSYLGLADSATLDNYRWVTIQDGKALCERLTIPFVLSELVVPAKLQIADATWTELESYTKTGTFYTNSCYTWVPSRAVGLVVDSEGDWVFDPDTYVPDTWYSNRNVPIIRAEVEPVDYCWSWLWTWAQDGSSQTGSLVAADYGALNRRLRKDTCPLTPSQLLLANTVYLHRRYGSFPVRIIQWPRNYADYERNFDNSIVRVWEDNGTSWSGPWAKAGRIPRVVRLIEDLGSLVQEVHLDSQGNRVDEVLITTTLEQAELEIIPFAQPLP